MNQSASTMISTMPAAANEIYEAVLSLARSIAGRTDLEALLSGVRESLRRIVSFDHLGLILYDADSGAMQGHILNELGNPVITSLQMAVEADPAGWVWLNQQPLILSNLDAETRWPEFISRSRAEFGLSILILVPLTAGENRLGAFGFTSVAPYEPSPAEMEFLERVATEFAVAVEGFIARQAAVRERDRLATLFDITNALVSKLAPDELFSAIGAQLSKVIRHDYSMLTVSNSDSGQLDLYALHSTRLPFIDALKGPFDPSGMPATEVLATGKPVVAYATDIERYPSPIFGKFVALGFRSFCSLPLVAPNRTIGTLALCRMTEDTWSGDDITFLVQVANQIAIAVENSLSYRELAEMKERLPAPRIHAWIKETHDCLMLLKDEMPKELSAFLLIRPNFEFKADDDRKEDYDAEADVDYDVDYAFRSKSAHRPQEEDPRTGMMQVADFLLDFSFKDLEQANEILKAAAAKLEIEGHSFPADPSDEKLGEKLRAARDVTGDTQRVAAVKIGGKCQHKYISEWETGKRTPCVVYAKRIHAYIAKSGYPKP